LVAIKEKIDNYFCLLEDEKRQKYIRVTSCSMITNIVPLSFDDFSPIQKHNINIFLQKLKDKKIYNTCFKPYLHILAEHQLFVKYTKFSDIFNVFDITTTRYSSFTYMENYRKKASMSFDGALYSSTLRLPVNAPDNKFLFVMDMNNTINKIMGIGIILNVLAKDQTLNIYDNPMFNNYVYKSNFYIPIIDINNNNRYFDYVESSWRDFIENEFESVIFYGKGHLKRGGSFTRFPIKRLRYRHLMFLLTLFILRNPNRFNDIVSF
jgi:hypothetical protein